MDRHNLARVQLIHVNSASYLLSFFITLTTTGAHSSVRQLYSESMETTSRLLSTHTPSQAPWVCSAAYRWASHFPSQSIWYPVIYVHSLSSRTEPCPATRGTNWCLSKWRPVWQSWYVGYPSTTNFRYIDDVLISLPQNIKIEEIAKKLNNVEPSINFIYERKSNNTIPLYYWISKQFYF